MLLGFIDLEINVANQKILDIGCIKENGDTLHSNSREQFLKFIRKVDVYVGHNIINHDIKFLKQNFGKKIFSESNCIDTLYLSTLLFPEKPYHALVKNDKLNVDSLNNPLNDAKQAQKLFYDEIEAFRSLDNEMKEIYYSLLMNVEGFSAFFEYIKYSRKVRNIDQLIYSKFHKKICSNVDLIKIIKDYPLELAYSLAIINTNDLTSLLPPWVIINHSKIEDIIAELRSVPCKYGCNYCDSNLNPYLSLNKYFDYKDFKVFNGINLQEKAVMAALQKESFVVIFPTGGGKSLTYQLPAIINAENARALTVVISPLQSLMKDQVDNLESKNIVTSVTINGLLDPIQRSKAIERVADGSAGILYIAPEALRSKTIEKLLLGRHIVRFVIDEAHCFSSWGHDFRVDYLYIAEFIKNIQEKKNQANPIPVSCFTATAKRNVIQDITQYFKDRLNLDMQVFEAKGQRKNLKYKVYEVNDVESKYKLLRNLIEQEACPTIIYASRRATVEKIQKRLENDNFSVSYFHGGLESDIKVEQQDKFMKGETQIMVATSAFGMGVDKKDVGCIIHYEISDSLENYVQESGRAGRDENIEANCYILYHEDDLNKHFNLLNQSRLNLKEIQQIWRAIKEKTKTRDLISQSALEIAKSAGWDESITDITTRVTTAIAALEDSGYIKRGQNSPRVFADSILVKSTIEAREQIQASDLIPEIDKENAVRIMQKLISTKYKSRGGDEVAESRIDYISDHLGIPKEEVIRIINNLRELKILSDDKDLTTIIKPNSKPQNALKILGTNIELLRFLASNIDEEQKIFNLKKLNEEATNKGINCSLKNLKTIINYSAIAKIIESKKTDKDHMIISLLNNRDITLQNIEKLYTLSEIIIKYLHELSFNKANENKNSDYQSFSVLELKNVYEKRKSMLDGVCEIKEIENAIFFMQKIDILQVEGGFLVIYNPMSINRIVKDNLKQYTKADYEKLENFYKSKMQQIHIVGEYASKMLKDYQEALTFVDDYFQYEYKDFLNKYFVGNRKEEIERNMSPARFKKLFASLSPHQIKIINDKEHQRISVAAGPGSGKTKLLVHKLASILYTEDIRHEQLLMLTFSRAAVMEFKSRLRDLIQGAAAYIDIKTFHSYCFDILGRVGSVEKTDQVIREAIELIRNREVDPSKVTKMVLVIDEAQDMNQEEYELIQELINYNENLRIIAVGDDDQNIFEFRGSNSQYFRHLSNDKDSFYELPINYRSKKSIVEFSNYFVEMISNRLKTIPIYSNSKDFGNIKVTRYLSKNLIIPVVNDVIGSKLDGTTCVITRTNEQALHITGSLKKLGKQVSLIQSNDDFNLYNLLELRNFCDLLRNKSSEIITKQVWDSCLEEFKVQNNGSINYDLCLEIISRFYDNDSRSIYLNDFFEFIYESNLSDFYERADIVVSTFHKAKGKEFDNVFILYDNEFKLNDTEKRQLYVGLTRAKSLLSIHTNNTIFKNLPIKNYEYKIEEQEFEIPDRLVYQLSHRDVNLGYSKFVKNTINTLIAGTKLEIDELPYLKVNGKRALQFSKAFYENIHSTLLKEYEITEAYVRYLVYWTNKDDNSENLIILPELVFDYKTSEDNQEVIASSSISQDINEVENIEIIEKEIEVSGIDKDNLRNALKEYRLDQAKVLKKPAFVVFSDKTLDDLIIRLPSTIEELYHVNGFGDNKINLYGESIVSIINKYVDKKYSI